MKAMFSKCISSHSKLFYNSQKSALENGRRFYSAFTQKNSILNSSFFKVGWRSFQRNRKPSSFSLKNSSKSITPEPGIIYEKAKSSQLLKPFCFTVAFTSCCYGAASIWQYETMRSRAIKLFHEQTDWWLNRPKGGELRQQLNRYWNNLHDGQKMTCGIIFLNCVVFLCWKIPKMQPFMLRYFVSSPSSKATCMPMLLSTFSHYSPLHLFVNMYVLFSFSTGIVHMLGKEQFLATYLSAGVISSFASYANKVVTGRTAVSLGASGAIMAVLGMVCTEFPNTQLAIIFLPFITFSAANALIGIIAFDTAGLFLGWRLLDHAAHLGGALSGILYVRYGQKWIWDKREGFVKRWHELRQSND